MKRNGIIPVYDTYMIYLEFKMNFQKNSFIKSIPLTKWWNAYSRMKYFDILQGT